MGTAKRIANPEWVQAIWDAISQQDSAQGMDFQRLKTLMVNSSTYKKGDNVLLKRELNQAVADGLVTQNGPSGDEEEPTKYSFPPPESFIFRGTHDWYCFRCHSPGEVVECRSCPRVYHLKCLHGRQPENGSLTCPACHLVDTVTNIPIEQSELNELLQHICNRFQKLETSILNRAGGTAWASVHNDPNCNTANAGLSEDWRFRLLVYQPMDLQTLIEKTSQAQYASLEEFQVDCETLVHGLVVYFGQQMLENGQLGERVLSTAMQEIEEIRLCPDCYRRSNGENGTWWFCSPCTVPHEVVWVKHPDCAYRPAKVMKNNGETYDVWYFGGDHERETVHRRNIQSIDSRIRQPRAFKTPSWIEAYEELREFQALAGLPQIADEPHSGSGCKGGSADTGRRGPRKQGASNTPEEAVTKKKSLMTTKRNSSGTQGTSKKSEAATAAPQTNGNQLSPPTSRGRPSKEKVGASTKWSELSTSEAMGFFIDPKSKKGDRFVSYLAFEAARKRMRTENATVNHAECGRASPRASQSSDEDDDDDIQVLKIIMKKAPTPGTGHTNNKYIDISHLHPKSRAIVAQLARVYEDHHDADLGLSDQNLEKQDRASLSGNKSNSNRLVTKSLLVMRLAEHLVELKARREREIADIKKKGCGVVEE